MSTPAVSCRPPGRTFGINQKMKYSASDIGDAIRKTKDELYTNCQLEKGVDYGWLEGQMSIKGRKVTNVQVSTDGLNVPPEIGREIANNYIATIKKFTLPRNSTNNIPFTTQIKKAD